MRTRLSSFHRSAKTFFAVLAAEFVLFGQQEETVTARLLKSSEADQVAYLSSYVADGAPFGSDDPESLVLSKTSLFVPILEQKIEEILRSRSREHLFKAPSIDPERVVNILAMMMEYTGEEIALEQASKLMKIDENRFGPMVEHSLMQAYAREKGFQLAYQGLEIGDPAVDKRIMAWVDAGIREKLELNRTITLRHLAEAMVEKYSGAPDEYQWAQDPIVSRLTADRLNMPGGLTLHDEMFRLIAEAIRTRLKK